MTELLSTKSGLPNTCCVCGVMQEVEWYVENNQQALAGQGKCKSCAFPKPKAIRKKRTTRRKPASSTSK